MPSDEQIEAGVVNELKKRGTIEVRNTEFKVRKAFYDSLLARGMSQAAVNAVVGSMAVNVPDEAFQGPIYNTAFDTSVANLISIWKVYCEELSEAIFISLARTFCFTVPF